MVNNSLIPLCVSILGYDMSMMECCDIFITFFATLFTNIVSEGQKSVSYWCIYTGVSLTGV